VKRLIADVRTALAASVVIPTFIEAAEVERAEGAEPSMLELRRDGGHQIGGVRRDRVSGQIMGSLGSRTFRRPRVVSVDYRGQRDRARWTYDDGAWTRDDGLKVQDVG
jgi:hypothetical protein